MSMSVLGGANVRHNTGLMGFFNLAGRLVAINSEIKEPPSKIGQSYKDGLRAVFWHNCIITYELISQILNFLKPKLSSYDCWAHGCKLFGQFKLRCIQKVEGYLLLGLSN